MAADHGPIESILRALAPHLRAELQSLGYPAYSPQGDDLLQEINVRIWKALEGRPEKKIFLGAYVKRVVFSVFINEVKRANQERSQLCRSGRQLCGQVEEASPRQGSKDDLKEIVVESLSSLSPAEGRVLRLRLEGFSFVEIAKLMAWPVRRTHFAYYRGIREIKKILARRGVYYED